MKNEQHTPGPWTVEIKAQSDYNHLYVVHESPTRSQIVADLHCPERKYFANGKEVSEVNANKMANARIIAAAPDLLALCEALLGELEYVHETGDVRDSIRNASEHMDRARAAIAKARGEG